MWNSTINQVENINGIIRITVVFSNGTQSFQETTTITNTEDFDSILQSRLNQLNALSNRVSAFPIGPYVPNIIAPISTPPAVSAVNFSSTYQWFGQVNKARAIGIITSASQTFQNALSAVQSQFNVSAVNLL